MATDHYFYYLQACRPLQEKLVAKERQFSFKRLFSQRFGFWIGKEFGEGDATKQKSVKEGFETIHWRGPGHSVNCRTLKSGESNRPLTPIHVKKYRDTPPISIAYFCTSMPSSWQKVVYTPPICITIRLPFVSRYFCRSIRVRGRWDTPNKNWIFLRSSPSQISAPTEKGLAGGGWRLTAQNAASKMALQHCVRLLLRGHRKKGAVKRSESLA